MQEKGEGPKASPLFLLENTRLFLFVSIYFVVILFTLALCRAASLGDQQLKREVIRMSGTPIICITTDASDEEWDAFYKKAAKLIEDSKGKTLEDNAANYLYGSIEPEHQDQS